MAKVIVAVAIGVLGATTASGTQPAKVFKIAILTDAMVPWHTSTEGFRDGLKEFGYLEGKNVIFEVRAAQGDMTRVPELAAELLQQKPDLLFCVSDACQRVTTQIPIVFTQVGDPVRLGLVKSIPLGRSRSNCPTGSSLSSTSRPRSGLA